MFARRRTRTPARIVMRERSPRRAEESVEPAAVCRETYGEVEAARLLLMELGLRHGPVD